MEVVLLLLQGVEAVIKRQKQAERQHRVQTIREDPVAEWNRRFKRVPTPSDKTKLPPDQT